MKANPFFELYVGDRISSNEFVTIFSPMLVTHTEPLFMPGNIVVIGIQGCGKSMLLKLLKPQTRIEYEQANQPFPVPEALRKFVCGSVNLGPVEIHRVRIIVAPMWIMASKLVSVLQARIAIRLNSLSF